MDRKRKAAASADDGEREAKVARRLSDDVRALLLELPVELQVAVMQGQGLRTVVRFTEVHREMETAVDIVLKILFDRDIRDCVRAAPSPGPEAGVGREIQRILDGEAVIAEHRSCARRYQKVVEELARSMVRELLGFVNLLVQILENGADFTETPPTVVLAFPALPCRLVIHMIPFFDAAAETAVVEYDGEPTGEITRAVDRLEHALTRVPLPWMDHYHLVRPLFVKFFMDLLLGVSPHVALRLASVGTDDDARATFPGGRVSLATLGVLVLDAPADRALDVV